MKTPMLYLSGAITRNPNYKREFEAARKDLTDVGYTVVSPIDICDDKWSWSTCMRRCIEVLVTQCDAVAIIPPEYDSAGMELEMQIAERLGMRVKTVEAWIKEGKNER